MGDCESVIVFPIRYRIAPGLSEAIEGNDLQFGGGGGGDWQQGIAEPHSTDAATEDQRQAVEEWLGRHPQVVEFSVGQLGHSDAT